MGMSGRRRSTLVTTLVFSFMQWSFTESSMSDDAPKSRDTVLKNAPKWLGPQTQPESAQEGFALFDDLYKVSLIVVRGDELKSMKVPNIVHFDDTVRRAPADWPEHIEKDAKYVLGRIRKKGRSHVAVYTLDCRIEDGPLKGAVVHLRDGRLPEDLTGEFAAYYRIPDEVEIDPGALKFRVVLKWYK